MKAKQFANLIGDSIYDHLKSSGILIWPTSEGEANDSAISLIVEDKDSILWRIKLEIIDEDEHDGYGC